MNIGAPGKTLKKEKEEVKQGAFFREAWKALLP